MTPTAGRFPSLAGLKAAHSELVQRRRHDGETAELLDSATQFVRDAQATGVFLDDEEERLAAQSLITYWANLLYRAGRDPVEAVLDDFDPDLAPDLPDALCPYVGLDAFREPDQQRFFGRRQMIDDLLARLHHERLLVVVGPSGSGKSSLVRAGLVPALRDGALPNSEGWQYPPPIVPGSEPLAALDRAIVTDSTNPATQTPFVVVVDQFEEVFTLVEDDAVRQAFVARLLDLISTPAPRHVVILTLRSDFESFLARLPALQDFLPTARVQMLPLSASEVREAIEQPAAAVGLKFEPGVVERLLQDILGEPAGLPLLQFTLLKLWEAREHNRVTLAAYDEIGGGRRALARSADAFYAGLIPEEQVTARRILLRMVRPGEGLEVTSNRVRRAALYQGGEDPGRVDRVLDKLLQARLVRLTPHETRGDEQVEVAHEALVRNWPTLVEWLENERSAIATRRRLEARAAEWQRLGGGEAGLLDEAQLRETERWLAGTDARYLGYDPALSALVEASRAAIEAQEREREAARQRELDQARKLAEEQRLRAEERERASQRMRRLYLGLGIMSILTIGLLVFALQSSQREIITRGQAVATAEQGQQLAQEGQRLATDAQATANANAAIAVRERQDADLARQQAELERAHAAQQGILARAGQLAALAQQQISERRPQVGLLLALESMNLAAQSQRDGRAIASVNPLTATADLAATAIVSQTLNNPVSGYGGIGLLAAGARGVITSAAISGDGGLLLAGGADGIARLWNTAADEPTLQAELSLGCPISNVALTASGWLATGCDDGRVSLRRIESPTAAPTDLASHEGKLTALTVSLAGDLLATAGEDGRIFVYNLLAENPAATKRTIERNEDNARLAPVRTLVFSANGGWLVSGGDDGRARLWNLATRDPISPRYSTASRFAIGSLAMSPNGRWLAIGGADERIDLWRFNETSASGFAESSPVQLYGRARAITSLVFDGDSRYLISGNEDGTARLWDLRGARPNQDPLVLSGHGGLPITALAARGRFLITGSSDGSARRWDVQAADPAQNSQALGGHDAAITAIVADTSGEQVVTAGADGLARLWRGAPAAALPTDTQELTTLVCRTVGRNLRRDEWNTFFTGQEYRKTCEGLPE